MSSCCPLYNGDVLRMDFRPFTVSTGVLPTANGSARVKFGRTEVMVGVKLDLVQPNDDTPSQGRVECSVSVSPGAMPRSEGRSPEDVSGELTEYAHSFTFGDFEKIAEVLLNVSACCFRFFSRCFTKSQGFSLQRATMP